MLKAWSSLGYGFFAESRFVMKPQNDRKVHFMVIESLSENTECQHHCHG